MLDFIHQPESTFRLGDYLRLHLQQQQWTQFRAAVAFVKNSGVRHINQELTQFSQNAFVKISVGIDLGGTSMEGLNALLNSIDRRGEVWIDHNENNYSTFHPKIYLFKNDTRADIVAGSGNLTEGGLFTNYEASLSASLDLTVKAHRSLLQNIEEVLDLWCDRDKDTARVLTPEFLRELVTNGYVKSEISMRSSARKCFRQ